MGEDEDLRDYQSGDDEGWKSSGSDEDTESRVGFDTSYGGKESFLDCEGEVVLEENMIFTDVHAFRAKPKRLHSKESPGPHPLYQRRHFFLQQFI